MTGDSEENNEKTTLVLIAGLILIMFVVFVVVVPAVVLLFSDSPDYTESVSCSLHENHSRYMKTEWLLSSNVSSYEDIPNSERRNLSAEAMQWLESERAHEYNPIKYSELSDSERDLFKRAVNNGTTFDRSNAFWDEDPTDLNFVFYNGSMYRCEISTPPRGA